MHFLGFLGILLLGFFLIRYGKWLRDSTGIRFDFAENFFGPGGTLTFMKIIGVGAIVFAFYYWLKM